MRNFLKFSPIKKQKNIKLNELLSNKEKELFVNLEDIQNKIQVEKSLTGFIAYFHIDKGPKIIGSIVYKEGKLIYIENKSYEILGFIIKGLGTYLLEELIKKMPEKILIIDDIMFNSLGFYLKVLKRFKEKGLIKSYTIQDDKVLKIKVIK